MTDAAHPDSMVAPSITAATVLDTTERQRAIDPGRSCIVQAPAGSGKTTLLAQRFVALLPTVEQPEQILAITFTKKAAAEMRQRVRKELADSESALGKAARAHALERGWQLEKFPARLKIQTIDAFAMSLVRQLPVTSALPQQDITQHPDQYYEQAAARVLKKLSTNDNPAEQGPLETTISELLGDFFANTTQVKNLLVTMLARREQWQGMLTQRLRKFDEQEMLQAIERGIESLHLNALQNLNALPHQSIKSAFWLLAQYAADNLDGQPGFAELDEIQQWQFVTNQLLLTAPKKGGDASVRKQLTKNNGFPPTKNNDHKQQALQRLAEIAADPGQTETLRSLDAIRKLPPIASAELDRNRLTTIGIVLLSCINELTTLFTEEGEVDYNQITLAAIAALGTEGAPSDLAMSLDYRISHVLIDEFQDTSRAQHELFASLIREWVPDDGNSFFAVGDPMQSVYRFRNADVSLFLEVCEKGIAGLPLEHLKLTSNFRSTDAMISWFNFVFAKVLGSADDRNMGTISYAQATSPRGSLQVPDHSAVHRPLQISASRAEQTDQLIAHLKELLATNEPAQIAILVRNRTPVGELVHALERAGIPWQGTDLHSLGDSAIVSDLVVLANSLFDPGDRVSALAFARSPLVGLNLTDLHALAKLVNGSLYALDLTLTQAALSQAGFSRLKVLLNTAEAVLEQRLQVSPRETIEALWLGLGGPAAYPASNLKHAERLLDVIEENQPLQFDPARLKRDLKNLYAEDDGNGVQILTIHKSKGLQYKHVLLPYIEASTRADATQLMLSRTSAKGWLIASRPPTTTKKGSNTLYDWLKLEDSQRARNEIRRVLYVAATRAEESLTMFATLPGDKKPTSSSLLETLTPVYGALWEDVTPLEPTQQTTAETPTTDPVSIPVLPASRPAPQPVLASIKLPARARIIANSKTPTELDDPQLMFTLDRRMAIMRGNLIHQSLCSLTRTVTQPGSEVPPTELETLLANESPLWQYTLEQAGLTLEQVNTVVEQTLHSLREIVASPLAHWCSFSPHEQSEAELPLTLWERSGPVKLAVDRTFVIAGSRWIIDYKTATPPIDATPQSRGTWLIEELNRYAGQLAGYSRALLAMYPDQPNRCALYFTAIDELWEIRPAPPDQSIDTGDHSQTDNTWVTLDSKQPVQQYAREVSLSSLVSDPG